MLAVIKDKDRVYMALTAIEMYHNNIDFQTHYSKNNAIIFKLKNHKNCIIGMDSHNPLIDLIKFNPDIFEKKIDVDNLVQQTLPKLKELARNHKCLEKDSDFRKRIYIAQDVKVYVIEYNGYVQEIEHYEAIGDYSREMCYASFYSTENMSALDRIKIAVNEHSKINCLRPLNYFLIDTKNTNLRLITNDE